MPKPTIAAWVQRKLASAVEAGIGEWGGTSETALGRSLYQAEDGPARVVLYEDGFSYKDASTVLECRYDQVETLDLAPLIAIMKARGDMNKGVTMWVTRRGARARVAMVLPLRMYLQIATVLGRIVDDLI